MPINFGVIGTGWITESFIAGAHASGQWKLTAVYSRSESSAKAFADKHHASAIHTSLSSLGADANIAAVYIASPNSLHFAQASELLRAKKHVILEKPAASNTAELDQLFQIAKENGVYLIEAFRHIQEVNYHKLVQNLDKLGPIYGASLNYASYSSRYNNVLNGETPNIFNLEFSGGALADLGVYPVSTAVALFGAPKTVTYKPIMIRTGADGGGHILLQYDDFGVSINASKIYTSTAPSEIYGEKGTIVLNAVADIERVTFLPADKKQQKEELAVQKAELNLQEEATEFARIVNEKDGKAAQRLEEVSRTVVKITEQLRKDNGLVFGTEK